MLEEMDRKIGDLEDQVVAPGLSGPKVARPPATVT